MESSNDKDGPNSLNASEKDSLVTAHLWLDVLRELLADFDHLSTDLKLGVIARLHHAGLRDEALRLWRLLCEEDDHRIVTSSAADNSVPNVPKTPPENATSNAQDGGGVTQSIV